MQLDRNGQKQIKFSGLSITPDVLLSNIFDDLFGDSSGKSLMIINFSSILELIQELKSLFFSSMILENDTVHTSDSQGESHFDEFKAKVRFS